MYTRSDGYLKYLKDAYFRNPDRENDYYWGAEGENYDHSKDGDPEWDCSGLFHAALTRGAGIKDTRVTANDYMHQMHKISRPSEAGDCAFHVVAGHATHIVMYTCDGYFIEARGRAYGIERHPISNASDRGLVWYRSDSINRKLREKVSQSVTPVPPLDLGPGSVYRLRKNVGKADDFLMTTDRFDAGFAVSVGYTYEGKAWQTPERANMPVSRFLKDGLHMYTTDPAEVGALTADKWKHEGIAFYVRSDKFDNARPVKRFVNHKTGGHIWSADAAEWSRLGKDWKEEGVVWYV